MIKRNEKLAFMQVTNGDKTEYKRMTEFTELTVSKNPNEFSRKYVDEDYERTDVTGYNTSISYKFDYNPDNPVHKEFVNITDGELTGSATKRTIIIVDLSKSSAKGGSAFNAISRDFNIVPNSEGDDANVYTYSGDLKRAGEITKGTATTNDEWQTIEFVEADK